MYVRLGVFVLHARAVRPSLGAVRRWRFARRSPLEAEETNGIAIAWRGQQARVVYCQQLAKLGHCPCGRVCLPSRVTFRVGLDGLLPI